MPEYEEVFEKYRDLKDDARAARTSTMAFAEEALKRKASLIQNVE